MVNNAIIIHSDVPKRQLLIFYSSLKYSLLFCGFTFCGSQAGQGLADQALEV